MTHWYSADTHFGHENVIKFCERPFPSSDEMDATILKNLTDRVGPNDDLWIVDDFAFGCKAKDNSYLEDILRGCPVQENTS